VNKSMYIHGAL